MQVLEAALERYPQALPDAPVVAETPAVSAAPSVDDKQAALKH